MDHGFPSPAASSAVVPIVLSIDAEPDGFFIDPRHPEPWRGLEQAQRVLKPLREQIAAHIGAPPRFTWMVRMDPQISVTYRSAAWPLERYRAIFSALRAAGDEIGLHVHTYRPVDGPGDWIVECADERWVEHCVRSSIAAFAEAQGSRPRVFSMGVHWMSNAIVQLLEEQGIEIDHSLLPGQRGRPMSELVGHGGAASGELADCRHVPRRPYRPSKRDFRIEDPSRTEGLWMLPATAIPEGVPVHWQRRLRRFAAKLIGRSRIDLSPLALRRGPAELRPGFERILSTCEQPHFVFEMRCNVFDAPDVWRRIQACLDYILSHPEAHRFRFVTPHEALELLGCVPASAARTAA